MPCAFPFYLHSSTPSSKCRCNQCTNTIMNDMIQYISSHDHFGPSILTLSALHRCLGPSAPSLAQASPPRGPSLQSLDLPFTITTGPSSQALSLSSPLWSHDSMSCLICNVLLLIITCGLISCVSPYNTLLVHLILSLNYQNQTRTFHLGLLHIIKGVELG